MPRIKSEAFELIFADPPFNLDKKYGRSTRDDLPEKEYVAWCRKWLRECIRLLTPGGAIFVYNLPKWNIRIGAYLMDRGLEFRHSIAIEIKSSLPIPGRLYPAHYSLLYFTKGKPGRFQRIRTQIETCRHCGGEIKDYGGHRNAMNPNGVTLKDVWVDIPPVRHWKFKSRNRRCNALSTKILDRVVETASLPGDTVFDPFGGSGTTFDVCERKGRNWIGVELDFADEIEDRLRNGCVEPHRNNDYVERHEDPETSTLTDAA